MIKVGIDQADRIFHIDFDVPPPEELIKGTELQFLIDQFDKYHCTLKRNKQGQIVGIYGNTAHLDATTDHLLNGQAEIQKEIIAALSDRKGMAFKSGLKINFHQNSFDTPSRYWRFILNQGHLVDYFFNRFNWDICPRNEYVTPFPLHVDIESASTCSMNCPMCYRDKLKKIGQMDFELFKKAIDECAAWNVFSVRLSWRGETLSHPRIKEMIAYACRKIKNVSFLTNAFYIDESVADCLIDNQVSYIAVSFDGMGEIYERIRHPAKFEDSYQKVAMIQTKKKAAGSRLPQVRLCTIWPAISHDPQAYYDTMKAVADYIVCNPYINFRGPMTIKPDFICQYPWERIVIGFNGETQCCTGWNADDIILGNVADETIEKMWHSDLMNKIRTIHAEGKRMSLNSCANCRHGAEGDPSISIDQILKRRY